MTEDDCILPIKRLIKGIWRNNPPPIPQLAPPISRPNEFFARGLLSKSPHMQETGDLIIIAFYYLLRCREYTVPYYFQRRDSTLMQAKRTKNFTVGYVGFWKGGCQLPHNSPLNILLQVEPATLKITNKKNGRMKQSIHHESFASDLFTWKALSRRIHHILTNGSSTESYISKYRVTSKDPFATFTPTYLITAIWLYVSAIKLHRDDINLDLVGARSLRAGGGGVSESAQGKQHHHQENGQVVQPNISHVHS